MTSTKKKRFFLGHKKSSALVVSVVIHAVFIVVALTFVAVQFSIKGDPTFEVKAVKRPQMKLRALQVPVKDQKKSQAPKLRQTLVSKPKTPTVDIKMPEITGVLGGTGYGRGGGLGGLGFGFDLDLFGGGSGSGGGNEFVGTFYDLKQSQEGNQTEIGKLAASKAFDRETQLMACRTIKNFISSGWNENRLKDYFKAPKLKYATAFIMPPMKAEAAPKAFGVEDQVKGSYWICHYKGQIAAPESGRYRFCGIGDDILVVRAAKRVALDASWPELIGQITSWKGRDPNNRKFPMNGDIYGGILNGTWLDIHARLERAGAHDGSVVWMGAFREIRVDDKPVEPYMSAASRMVIGDWIDLRKGQRMDVEILIGEVPGGDFSCRLLIEQEGKEYPMVESDAGPRPVLPIFKTVPVNEKIIGEMKLVPTEMTLDGPSLGVLENAPKPQPL